MTSEVVNYFPMTKSNIIFNNFLNIKYLCTNIQLFLMILTIIIIL